ncbi:MAG: hypothetical protein V4773_03955 [Verrucomicrobiota bacterium]
MKAAYQDRVAPRRESCGWKALVAVVSLAGALSGCVHLHGIAGGVEEDDFYVIMSKQFLIFETPPVVLHCARGEVGPVGCTRVLTAAQAGSFRPQVYDDSYANCAADADYVYRYGGSLPEVLDSYQPMSTEARRGCVDGFELRMVELTGEKRSAAPSSP